MDSKYPKEDIIWLVLDNLQVHTSKKTRKYLANIPGRFEFIFTSKHGSCLNLVEKIFSKLNRQSLKGISVKTKSELVLKRSMISLWFITGHFDLMESIRMKKHRL